MGRRPRWGRAGKTIAVYISLEEAGFVKRAADAEHVSISEIVRRAIRRFFFLPISGTISPVFDDTETTEGKAS